MGTFEDVEGGFRYTDFDGDCVDITRVNGCFARICTGFECDIIPEDIPAFISRLNKLTGSGMEQLPEIATGIRDMMDLKPCQYDDENGDCAGDCWSWDTCLEECPLNKLYQLAKLEPEKSDSIHKPKPTGSGMVSVADVLGWIRQNDDTCPSWHVFEAWLKDQSKEEEQDTDKVV